MTQFGTRPRLGRRILREAAAGIGAKPARALLTSLGVAAGVAVFVLTIGISDSAGRTIVARLADRSGTIIEVRPTALVQPDLIPATALASLARLEGVTSVASISGGNTVDVASLVLPGGAAQPTPLFSVSPSADDALDLTMKQGSFYDTLTIDQQLPVAVLGAGAAHRLHVHTLSTAPTITIVGTELAVVAIIEQSTYEPALLNAVIVPAHVAANLGVEGIDRIVVRAAPETRDAVATVAALAVLPNQPDALQVLAPIGERQLQETISQDLNALLLTTGLVTIAIGAIAVGNVLLMSVLERRSEIGLRRALGARRSHIAGQFLTEAAIIGAFGAIIGASVGTIGVSAIAAINQWDPTLPPTVPILAVAGGIIVGTTAGIIPARRASTIEPVTALRAG